MYPHRINPQAEPTDAKLVEELIKVMDETKSPATLVVAMVPLVAMGKQAQAAIPAIIRNAEAAKPKPEAKSEAKPSAKAEDLDRLTAMLEEVLAHSGYVHARVEGSTHMKIRRLIRRMDLTAHDAEVWQGMLRQIQWKLLS